MFRTPFLVPSSYEVSSAILNRAAQSLKSVPDNAAASLSTSNDQYSEPPVWRFVPADFQRHYACQLRHSPIATGLFLNSRSYENKHPHKRAFDYSGEGLCRTNHTLSRSSASGSNGTTSRDDRRG